MVMEEDYISIHTGQVIDGAISAVINGRAGLQGIYVNGTELEPDDNNKVSITLSSASLYTATLLENGWTNSAPYSQTVNVQGILATDTPIVDIVLSSSNADEESFSWLYVSKIITSNGSITATCLESKPTIDMQIQLKVIR